MRRLIGLVAGLGPLLALAAGRDWVAPIRLLLFCDRTAYQLTAPRNIRLLGAVPKTSFVFDNGSYEIHIEASKMLSRFDTVLVKRDVPATEVDAHEEALRAMRRAANEKGGHIDLGQFNKTGTNLGATFRVLVEDLVAKGDVAVVSKDYVWAGDSFLSGEISTVIAYEVAELGAPTAVIGTAFCDPLGGDVFFQLASVPVPVH